MIILSRSIKHVYLSHKDELIKLLLSEKLKPFTHKDLELVTINGEIPFFDSENKTYYRFGKKASMSVDRFGEMMHYTQYLAKGLSPEEDQKIDDTITRALDDGIRNPQKSAAAKIGAAVQERQERKKKCFHSELLYNILAVQFIREDENPATFDNEMQMKKVAEFKKDITKERAYFFFQQPELKRLIDLSTSSPEDVMTLLEESKEEAIMLSKRLSLIREFQTTSKPGDENGRNL